ncbi:MAG: hypothetical protein RIR26_693 [Pseudomonadota bacterium]
MLKKRHNTSLLLFLGVASLCPDLVGCQGGNKRGRLESYRALAARETDSGKKANAHSDSQLFSNAQLSSASLVLQREDLIPCEELPPRKLNLADGEMVWVDGGWAHHARPFIVKGSAQSGVCALEVRPLGQVSLNPGGNDPFIRGKQIRFLLTTASGDAVIPADSEPLVNCSESNGAFDVSFEGIHIGKSPISYVMNEAVPLDLAPRICLARVLSADRIAKNEWMFILPIASVSTRTTRDLSSPR